jgi:cation diffusion facilitator family transporter
MATKNSSKTAVYGALVGNVLVAATKLGAALWTGSASMMSEAIHSFVDTGNEILLLYGMRRASLRPDVVHPLGYGRELYFWSFIVALLIFALGAGVSIYQGVLHVRQPESISDPHVNYVVLALAFVFEGISWLISLRQFRASKGDLGYYEAFRRSKDPPSFMVLFEDSAALVGILVAAGGTYGASALAMPVLDGIASILIGMVLGAVSVLLARESKSLLIGERADARLGESLLRIAAAEQGVESANGVLTTQLAPDQIVAALSIDFEDALTAGDVEAIVQRIEENARAAHPNVVALFVKPQTDRAFAESMRRRYGMPPAKANPS